MKLLKHFLIIGMICTGLSALHAQGTPPEKPRGNSTFTQVDDYLNVKKRIGIPAGTLETLNGLPGAPAYLYFRTDSNTLRVYNPETSKWVNAVPGINQGVLLHTTGNETKTGNLQLNGDFNTDGSISSTDGSIRAFRYSDGLGITVLPEFLKFKTDPDKLQFEGRLQAPKISDNRDWYLPDTSGVIAVGDFIKASPLNPQDANINISGGLYVKGKDDIFLNFDPANEIAPNPFTIKIGDTDTGIHWYGDGDISMRGNGNDIFRFSPGNVLYLPVTPNTATSDYSLLTRDNSTGWVKQIEPDALGMIKASPATPQEANINITGDVNAGVINAKSANFEIGASHVKIIQDSNGYSGFAFGAKDGPGVQMRYQPNTFDRGLHIYDPQNPSNTGIGNDDWRRILVENEDTNVKTLTIKSLVTATAGFTMLVRDNETGEIKKIELADLKAMLNAIQ